MCTKELSKDLFVEIKDYCEAKAKESQKQLANFVNPIFSAIVEEYSIRKSLDPQDKFDPDDSLRKSIKFAYSHDLKHLTAELSKIKGQLPVLDIETLVMKSLAERKKYKPQIENSSQKELLENLKVVRDIATKDALEADKI